MDPKVKRLIQLARFPESEWKVIAEERPKPSDLRINYITPLILCLIIATVLKCTNEFIAFAYKEEFYEYLLKICCKEIVVCICSTFVGYHVATLVISGPLTEKLFKTRPSYQDSAIMTSYIFSYYLIIDLITTLFPILFLLKALILYLVYLTWFGVPSIFPEIEEEQRQKFTLYTSAIICLAPLLMEKIMLFLMKH